MYPSYLKIESKGCSMTIFEVGRLCMKIAGRDAGRTCVVVEQLDNTFVLVDGDVRRKKVNVKHLEPLPEMISIVKGAAHEEVAAEFKKLGMPVWVTKPKQRAARVKADVAKKEKKVKVEPKKKTGQKKE